MTYDHPVRITRPASAPGGDGAAPAPVSDEDAGWGASADTPAASVEVVYEGPADVQDGQRTLRRLSETGEAESASAVVYLPPAAASAFALVRVGDRVEAPQGTGRVVALMQTDAALAVSVTASTPAVPEVLA